MAQSPAHKFGQIVGDMLEAGIEPVLREFASRYDLYLDTKGHRPVRGRKRKVSWTDNFGNVHDLDFVLERNGTPETTGAPVAFIESAWRRYTKHSRNKAQEIQGAILPLRSCFQRSAPFTGVVLAGEFTEGAISQLASQGFTVLYFPYMTVVHAFSIVGINALFDEETSDNDLLNKVRKWEKLSSKKQQSVSVAVVDANRKAVCEFMSKLRKAIERSVASVRILPLFGSPVEQNSIEQAMLFITTYDESHASLEFIRYEIRVDFDNGDMVSGNLSNKESALEFLRFYQPSGFCPVT